jgi:hypothetical protein
MAKKLANPDGTRDVGVLIANSAVRAKHLWSRSWHKSEASYFPADRRTFDRDYDTLIRDYILPGHVPAAPLLEADDVVIALGSCFAAELRKFMTEAGLAATHLRIPEGLTNTFAIRDFVSWVVTGAETGRGFRYDRLESGEIAEWVPPEERGTFASAFAEAGAFVFAIGLAEVWEDVETGGVFWRGVPKEIFEADRHVFRITTVEENRENILATVDLLRAANPNAPIIVSLSPVPLEASFRGISCMTADAVSKSVLRVALDLVMAEHRPNVWYWPGFEMIRWVGAHASWPAYGFHDDRSRHVTRWAVQRIIQAFGETFYAPEAVAIMRERMAPAPSPLSVTGRWHAVFERRQKRRLAERRAKKRQRRAHERQPSA